MYSTRSLIYWLDQQIYGKKLVKEGQGEYNNRMEYLKHIRNKLQAFDNLSCILTEQIEENFVL